jgi:hypothetical protein
MRVPDFDSIQAAQKLLYPLRLPEQAALHPLDQAGVNQVISVIATFGSGDEALANRLHAYLLRELRAVTFAVATAALATFWVHHRRPWITGCRKTTDATASRAALRKLIVQSTYDEYSARSLSERLPPGTPRAAVQELRDTIARRGYEPLFPPFACCGHSERAVRMIDALVLSPSSMSFEAFAFSRVLQCARAQRATLEFLLQEEGSPGVHGILPDLGAASPVSLSSGGSVGAGGLALESEDQERQRLVLESPPPASSEAGGDGAGADASPEDLLELLGDLEGLAQTHDRPRG